MLAALHSELELVNSVAGCGCNVRVSDAVTNETANGLIRSNCIRYCKTSILITNRYINWY